MKPFHFLSLIICLAIPLLAGGLSGYATMDSVHTWYTTLQKPSFNPPDYLFGPVWTGLYCLMGISLYLIWQQPESDARKKALVIFGIQLVLNFCWSFLFFYFRETGIALAEIMILWVFIILMIIHFHRVSKTAAYLQSPYLLWVSFASLLNAAIWKLN